MRSSRYHESMLDMNLRHRIKTLITPRVKGVDWGDPVGTLSRRWSQLPLGPDSRVDTTELLKMKDGELLSAWESARTALTTGEQFGHRGWYHRLYADTMQGKKVLDIGSGLAVDSITFAQRGARLTFVDLVVANLEVLERVTGLLGIRGANFVLLEDFSSLQPLPRDFDTIMAMGSLHHAPSSVIQPEVRELTRHLKVGGRWLQLAYPKSRWLKQGSPPFSKWGQFTDGTGTPWAEWYDLPKVMALLSPARFDVVLDYEFYNCDFIWFDLIYRGGA